MRIPTFTLEKKKLPRVIFSILPLTSDLHEISSLMEKTYEMGIWCFDLPTANHLGSFRELRSLTEDETLVGFPHLKAEEGVSLLGKPLHRFESKLISTIRKNLFPPHLIRELGEKGVWSSKLFFPLSTAFEVFTQKEIDRIAFDPYRFDQALSCFRPEESPFLLLGEKYGDWLLALGRIDLLKKMALRAREKGFAPIYSGYWTTFVLPKVKPLDVAAYAFPVNKRWSPFDLDHASALIKRFDRPLISLDPLADGALLKDLEEAFLFLFETLKIQSAIASIASEEEGRKVLNALERFPSLIPPRKT